MSEGRSRDAVLAALRSFPARLGEVALAAASRPVPAGEWGPREVVRHLIACETDVHQARLADLDAYDAPVWEWNEPGPWAGEADLTLTGMLARFADLRTTTLVAVGALDEAGWARTGTHTTLGVFDVRALLANAVDHDEQHIAGLTS